jgi:hypothetical protein
MMFLGDESHKGVSSVATPLLRQHRLGLDGDMSLHEKDAATMIVPYKLPKVQIREWA